MSEEIPAPAHGGTVLILGATSTIARELAAALARRGYLLYLGARDCDELARVASDLSLRFKCIVHTGYFDATDSTSHGAFLKQVAETTTGNLHGVVAAFGLLGENARAVVDFDHAADIIAINYVAAVSALTAAIPYLQRGGFILGLSSVAGERGRQSNYVYGSAKGAFTIYLQGLRNQLASAGVHVTTAKMGFVDTQMTYGLRGMFFVASPHSVGEALARAVEARRDIVYIPGFWRWVMLVIRAIPERWFKRLKL